MVQPSFPSPGTGIMRSQAVDAAQDPQRAAELSESVLSDDRLFFLTPNSQTVTLSKGVATVRELTGEDEEYLVRELRGSFVANAVFLDRILQRTVTNLQTSEGDSDGAPSQWALRNLWIGDRLTIALVVRMLTYGTDYELPQVTCRVCSQEFGVVVELNKDIVVAPFNGHETVKAELRNGHVATLRLPTGQDELEAIGNAEQPNSIPKQVTVSIDRCVVELDGKRGPFTGLGEKLGSADRKKIMDALADASFGPKLEEVKLPCSKCGSTSDYALSIADMFR